VGRRRLVRRNYSRESIELILGRAGTLFHFMHHRRLRPETGRLRNVPDVASAAPVTPRR
jgi:hypothetical protein